jgi:hypothetical protein
MSAAQLTQAATRAQLQADVYQAAAALTSASKRGGLASLLGLPRGPSPAGSSADGHAPPQQQQQRGRPGLAGMLGLRSGSGGTASQQPLRPMDLCLSEEWMPASAPPLQQRRCAFCSFPGFSCQAGLQGLLTAMQHKPGSAHAS